MTDKILANSPENCSRFFEATGSHVCNVIGGHCQVGKHDTLWWKVWNTSLSRAISRREVIVKFRGNDCSRREILSMQEFWRILLKMQETPAESERVDMYAININVMGMTDCIVVENTIFALYFLFEYQECAKISWRQKVSCPLSAKICLR